jgi:hypothetical protein
MFSPLYVVLDGIREGLDPLFDITEIAKLWFHFLHY